MSMNGRSIANEVIVVTGGGTGIGRGAGHALAAANARVILCGRRKEVLAEAVQSGPADARLDFRVLDVADRDAVDAVFGEIQRTFGSIDVLVNAAGVNTPQRSMAAMRPAEWDRILKINATGVYNCMHAVLPDMRARKRGLIINISSIAGLRASALGGVAYAASKFAVAAIGTAVGNEDNVHGIRVTTVFPGEVDTPLLKQRPEQPTPEQRASMLNASDVGQVVRMLVTLPEAVHIPDITVKPLAQEFV